LFCCCVVVARLFLRQHHYAAPPPGRHHAAATEMYAQQPHAAWSDHTGQAVVAFVSQNAVWAFCVAVGRLALITDPSAADDDDDDKIVATSLYSGPGISSCPYVSPDCRHVAFSNDQTGWTEVYVVDIKASCVSSAAQVYLVHAQTPARRLTFLAAASECVGWGQSSDFNPSTTIGGATFGAAAAAPAADESESKTPSIGDDADSTQLADATRPTVRFVSYSNETHTALESVWHVHAAGGAPACSGLGECDYYAVCDQLDLHVVGRYTRDAHCITGTWKVRTLVGSCVCTCPSDRVCVARVE
jgi:hypothetical protein